MMRTFKIISVSFLTVLFPFILFSQQSIDLNAKLQSDPDVKIGKLENGITYYLKKNLKPENRLELRLAVNAGSILEDDNQQGLAHFCEHMCFNGTKNFPKNELINTIEKMGIKFGNDLNAYTSFDETVYMLKVPTDQPELINKGFQILEDWANNVSFDNSEIDKERGVILEERRLGLGAEDRMRKKSFPVIFKGSKYADRVPIGTKEVLENFKYETLKDFYKTWYRPDLISVVAVGNMEIPEMEKKVTEHFGKISPLPNPRKRDVFDLPDNIEPLISIETDPEATSSILYFFYKHPVKYVKTVGDYKEKLMNELFSGMLQDRYEEIGQKPDAPFIYSGSSYGRFLARTKDAFMNFAMSKENQIDKCFKIMLTENERVKRFGFTKSEFERQKSNILTNYEINAKEYDKMESGNLAMEYVYNYLEGNPVPGAKQEFELVKSLLPEIEIEKINALAKKWITDNNMVILVMAPQKEGIKVPDAATLLNVIKNVRNEEIEPYTESLSEEPLVDELSEGCGITGTKQISELDVTEIDFNNGIKIVLKKTDFKNNEIKISAFQNGGSSLIDNENYISAMFASGIAEESGVSKFNKTDLKKKLAGKDVSISPVISELKHGFYGKCSPKDLETALQLIYLYFNDPRKDNEAFEAFVSKTKSQFMFFANNPQYTFYKKLVEIVTQNHPRAIVLPTVEQLEKINLEVFFDFFSKCYSNANGYTFFFVGNFESDEITPLLRKYLGNLPSSGNKPAWKDMNPEFPSETKTETVYKGIEDKGMVGLVWNTGFAWNTENLIRERILTKILDIKLRETVREDQGGTYGLQVFDQAEKYPKQEYSLTIIFGCDPKRQDKLVKVIFSEMNKLIKNGPTEEDLEKVKEILIRERETDLKKNEWWLRKLENNYFYDEPKTPADEFNKVVKAVKTEDIKTDAQKYFNMKHYVKVYLKPEKKK